MTTDQHIRVLGVFGAFLAIVPMLNGRACLAEVTPAHSIAAQIRLQGYRRGEPVSAERDAALSKPEEAVWILRCQNATYRVRLIPDLAARVEQLE
jgi:hypothetical protein